MSSTRKALPAVARLPYCFCSGPQVIPILPCPSTSPSLPAVVSARSASPTSSPPTARAPNAVSPNAWCCIAGSNARLLALDSSARDSARHFGGRCPKRLAMTCERGVASTRPPSTKRSRSGATSGRQLFRCPPRRPCTRSSKPADRNDSANWWIAMRSDYRRERRVCRICSCTPSTPQRASARCNLLR